MKIYAHDYTLPSQAEDQMYLAYKALGMDDTQSAMQAINKARYLLNSYLAQDNMVEDDDVDGWVKLSDLSMGDGEDWKLI